MLVGTHYYVLSLSTRSTVLYEAFRDALIPVENQGFPVAPAARAAHAGSSDDPRALMRTVDESFDFYHVHEPLGLIVVGDPALQSAFDAVTTHGAAVVGRVKGDRSGTGADDLGQMVWPVVKEVLAAVGDRALRALDDSSGDGRVVSGLEAVAVAATGGACGALLVEDEYRVRGSLVPGPQRPAVSAEVDVRDIHDDVVDAVIERVLERGGHVVFLRDGALADRGRIALLLQEEARP